MASVDPNGKPENYVVIINDGSKPGDLTTILDNLSLPKSHVQIVGPDSLNSILPDSVTFTPLNSTSLQTVISGLKGKIDGNDRLVVLIQGITGYVPQSSPFKTCINIKGDKCYSIDQFDTEIKRLSYGSLLVVADFSYFSDSFSLKPPISSDSRFQRRAPYDSRDDLTSSLALASIHFLLEKSIFHEDISYYLGELNSKDPIKLKETLNTLLTRNDPTLAADTQSLVRSLIDILINSDFAPNIRGLAVQKLGQIGKLASSALTEIEQLIALNDPNDKKNYIRATALDTFSKIVSANPEAIPLGRRAELLEQVKRKINSESPSMRTIAAQAYGRLAIAWNNPADIEAFKAFLSDPSQSETIRRAAIEVLYDADEKRFLEINIELILKSDNEGITYKALENLDDYLDKHRIKRENFFSIYSAFFNPLTDKLIALLDEKVSTSDDTRLLVVSILRWMGARAEKALPKLKEVVQKDASPQVKDESAMAIRIINKLSQDAKRATKQGK